MIWSRCNGILTRNGLQTILSSKTFQRHFSVRRHFSVSTFRLNTSEYGNSRTRITEIDFSELGLDRIRNFSIIAHVDHGKSTLADRMLEFVGAITSSPANKQVLDKLRVERERGITVKAQTASVIYKDKETNIEYLLNLIDTPGHVDFSSEVSRSLSGCQGVILLVDANSGVQAQTVSNFFMAFSNDLVVVPVINKIDLPNADPDTVKTQLEHLFEISPDLVLCASAKLGIGIEDIFRAIIKRIPPPNRHGTLGNNVRLLLQDSWYDKFRGAVNLVQVFDGQLKKGDQIMSNKTGLSYYVKTLGILAPDEMEIKALYPGQVGVMTCNMRSTKEAIIGDTFFLKDRPVEPLMEVTKPKPMVYAGFYPLDPIEQDKLKSAIEKVSLNDYSVTVEPETSLALGFGYRLGFLGLLHLEVFSQRLEDEYSAEVLVTTPSVPYKIVVSPFGLKRLGSEIIVRNPAAWPEMTDIESTWEPIVKGTIICPTEQMGDIIGLITEYRGYHPDIFHMDQHRVKLEMILPLSEIVTNFFDDLKSMTSGYGSFDYEDAGYQESNLVKVDVLLNDKPVSELAFIAHAAKAKSRGMEVTSKLKENLPRQQFAIKIQAAVNSRVLAREDLKAYRKDVTAKCYGGDIRRKMKLLANQAEGKKRMRSIGKIEIEKDTFIKLLTRKPSK